MSGTLRIGEVGLRAGRWTPKVLEVEDFGLTGQDAKTR